MLGYNKIVNILVKGENYMHLKTKMSQKIICFFAVILTLSMFYAGCADNVPENNSDNTGTDNYQPVVKTSTAPVNVKAELSDSGLKDVKLSWTDSNSSTISGGSNYYMIYYNTTNDTATATSQKILRCNEYTIQLPSSTKYYIWMKAFFTYGGSLKESDFSQVVTIDLTLPVPELSLTTASMYAEKIQLEWSYPSNYKNEYKYGWIYRNTTDDSSTAEYFKTFDYYYSYEDLELSEPGTYYYWVKAANAQSPESEDYEASDFSESVSYTFAYKGILIPKNLKTETSAIKNEIKLSWDINPFAEVKTRESNDNEIPNYCWVYYNTTNDSSTAVCQYKVFNSKLSSNSYNFHFDQSGTYYCWVRLADGDRTNSHVSDFSAPVSINYVHSKPDYPTGLTITPTDEDNKVKVTWTSNNSWFYYIYYGTTNNTANATYEVVPYSQIGDTPETIITLSSKGTYYFWIRTSCTVLTTNNDCKSDFSPIVTYINN